MPHLHIRLHGLVLNPLNAQLNPTCHLLASLAARHILHVSGIRVNLLSLLHLGKGCWGEGVLLALLNTRLLSYWTCCISDEPDGTDYSGLDCCDLKSDL